MNERLGYAAALSIEEQSNRKTPSSKIGSKNIFPDLASELTVFSSLPDILDTNANFAQSGLLFLHAKDWIELHSLSTQVYNKHDKNQQNSENGYIQT